MVDAAQPCEGAAGVGVSHTERTKTVNRIIVLALAASAAAMCAGCGGGGGSSIVVPPEVVSTQLSPTILSSAGGNVTISSQVEGDRISQVRAAVTLPDSSTVTVPMTGSAGSYTGVYAAPRNETENIQSYTVTVRAINSAGAYDDGESKPFIVLPPDAPPPPPGP